CLPTVLREGLLDQHVLAGLDREDRGLVVVVVGRRDVHGIDVVTRDKVLVVAVGVASVVRSNELLRALKAGRRRCGNNGGLGEVLDGVGELGGNASCAEDAPPDRGGLHGIGCTHGDQTTSLKCRNVTNAAAPVPFAPYVF